MPSLSNGPPTFCAVPPMVPSGVKCLPSVPDLSKILVPAPEVFSPAGGWQGISKVIELGVWEDGEEEKLREGENGRSGEERRLRGK